MLLGSSKVELDRQLGKPIMARNVVGLPGEKAYLYRHGDFDLVVGFLNDVARYLAVVRHRGPKRPLSPAELAGALALNAPASLWTLEVPDTPAKKAPAPRRKSRIEAAPTTYLSYVEPDPKIKGLVVREIRGWMPGDGPYAFFYLPAAEGEVPLLVSEWGVHQALG